MNFLEEEQLDKLRKRYSHLHLLVFHRSVERARDIYDLFDILETIPKKYPIVWDENNRFWKHESDIVFEQQLSTIRKK